ncbi:DUF3040 domain-containing protein [Microbacterium sp. NC79]|uniref:DUF3040 domain-containing protein n=1 Tax=Microbacterium sp. NC79 TaxID=2851009 RepID=UPI001C2C59B4|nr:DUF3040 domain-containing protein [Microbacterium sp. NC79]MBV0895115.1 DUF3040 domain-containing protein [Microbacterium sp. NC79]
MPLSEQEQRMLDEMERNLLRTDADVVSATPTGAPLNYRNLVLGAVFVVVGLGAMVAGVAMFQSLGSSQFIGIIVGLLGFALMFFGVVYAVRPSAKTEIPAHLEDSFASSSSAHRGSAPRTGSKQSGFMDRMNDRWDRRQNPED